MARCATAIDSHVHVWLRREDCEPGDRFFEFAEGQTPTVCATPSALLAEMDDAGIDGALIVQPINYKFDHAFVQNTIASNKQRFMGCLLADPSAGMDGIAKMEELAATGCFRFVRFNPYLFPNTPSDGKGGMSGAVGRALYKKAGELSLPVGVMAFRGIIPLEEDINALMKEAPDTKMVHLIVGNHPKPEQFGHLRSIALHCIIHMNYAADALDVRCSRQVGSEEIRAAPQRTVLTSPMRRQVLDHFGFAGSAPAGDGPAPVPESPCSSEEWMAVLRIMRSSANAYLKLSAFDRQSGLLLPSAQDDGEGDGDDDFVRRRYAGVQALIRDAVDKIGADRLMWGTDYPFVNDTGNLGYLRARRVVETTPGLSSRDIDLIMGGTLLALLPGAWEGAAL